MNSSQFEEKIPPLRWRLPSPLIFLYIYRCHRLFPVKGFGLPGDNLIGRVDLHPGLLILMCIHWAILVGAQFMAP